MKRNRKVTTAAMTPNDIDPSFAPVVAAFAKDRHVSRRRMFSSSAVLNVNGKIFAMFKASEGTSRPTRRKENSGLARIRGNNSSEAVYRVFEQDSIQLPRS